MTQEMDLFVNVYHLKNPELLQKLTDLVQVRRFPRGKVILHSGEQQTQVMLLLEGIVRGYFLDLDGSEHTDCFCIRRGDPAMPPCGLEDPSPINLSTLSGLYDGRFAHSRNNAACAAVPGAVQPVQHLDD